MFTKQNVEKTIYYSLAIQIITSLVSLDGINFDLSERDYVLKDVLKLELVVQVVETLFYLWVVFASADLNAITPRRYIDWFITTPTMLVSTIIFMEYLRKKEANEDTLNFWTFLQEHKENIIKIISYNFFMLIFGLLGELNIIDKKIGVSIGFIFFYLSFKLIYDEYAHKTEGGKKLFAFLVSIWSLYGVSAMLPIFQKNTCYNILDIVAKNFYGLFIYYYITGIGTRKGYFFNFTKKK